MADPRSISAGIETLSSAAKGAAKGLRESRERERLERLEKASEKEKKTMADLRQFQIWIAAGWTPASEEELEKLEKTHPGDLMLMTTPESVSKHGGTRMMYKLTPEAEEGLKVEAAEKVYEIQHRSVYETLKRKHADLARDFAELKKSVAKMKAGKGDEKDRQDMEGKHKTLNIKALQEFHNRAQGLTEMHISGLNTLDEEPAQERIAMYERDLIGHAIGLFSYLPPIQQMEYFELMHPFGGAYGNRVAARLLSEGTENFAADFKPLHGRAEQLYKAMLLRTFVDPNDSVNEKERKNSVIESLVDNFSSEFLLAGQNFYRMFNMAKMERAKGKEKGKKKGKKKEGRITQPSNWGQSGDSITKLLEGFSF